MTTFHLIFIGILLASLQSFFVAPSSAEDCTVTIQNGTILGSIQETDNPEKSVCSFTGIPYAAPPVGVLRFKAPQPAFGWGNESLNATLSPNWCPQGTGSVFPGVTVSEDCLYLNVHTPQNASSASRLPVMLWIHGGAYTSGSSLAYTPTKLLARGDVVLVVIHYRLGLLGFLSTGDEACPGNNGLKDQQQSIRWINENILEFGGDPTRVTVAGESAGSGSAIYQILSPLNQDLIAGLVCQSGTSFGGGSPDSHPKESADIMASRLGCSNSNTSELVQCLRGISWETIVEEQGKFIAEGIPNLVKVTGTVSPVVEPDLPGAFITKTPLELMETGDIPYIPVMIGATKHDGSLALAGLYRGKIGPEGLDRNASYMKEQIVPDILKYFNIPVDTGNGANAASVELAFLSGVNRSSWEESMPGLVDMMTVYAFKSSIEMTAKMLTKRNLNVYLYSFEHHSQNSYWPLFVPPSGNVPVQGGICHADDLIHMFPFPGDFSAEDLAFSEVFCDIWLNFVKFGNPTPTATDKYDQWPLYNTLDESYMKLNGTPKSFPQYRSSWRPNGFEWN